MECSVKEFMNILEVFTYNQHFVAMMNIINAARLNPPESGHKHHIIPRCWFKMMKLPIDNSKTNLILLSYEDHIKVHKLAILCANSLTMKSKLACAYHRLTQGEVVDNNLWKGKGNPFYGKHHTEEARKKMINSHYDCSGINNPFYGKQHSEETCKKLSESHKGKEPWNKGKSSSFKGKHWKLINGKRMWYE